MSEWYSEETAVRYAEQTADPQVGWFESEVNFPDVLRLIPEAARAVLDFGCGPGEFTQRLSEHFTVVGTDIDPMVSIARKNHPNVSFFEWNGVFPVPQEMAEYDVVFCKLVIQFFENLHPVLMNFRGILKANGVVVCSVPHPDRIAKKLGMAKDAVAQYQDTIGDTGIVIRPFYRSQHAYVEAFTRAGFTLAEVSEPYISEDVLQKHAVPSGYNDMPNRLNMRFTKTPRA